MPMIPGLINDPIPIRGGLPYGGGSGTLTKREMAKVRELLKNASGQKLYNVDLTISRRTKTSGPPSCPSPEAATSEPAIPTASTSS